jgi:hypothetical protein
MPLTPGSSRTPLNGATPVTVVAAPGVGVHRHILHIHTSNIDTAAVTVTLRRNIGGTSRQFRKRTGLAVDGEWTPIDKDHPVIITGTDTIEGLMAGAAATTNPDIHAEWIDKS